MKTAFKLQDNVVGVFRVAPLSGGPQTEFSSIQAAINAAVAAGHTSAANPATVEVYPGIYTENVALAPGVNLKGTSVQGRMDANGTLGITEIVGNMTYANSNGLTANQNAVTVENISLSVLNGSVLVFSGTAPAILSFRSCVLQKQTGGNGDPMVSFSNNGAGSRLRFFESSLDQNAVGSVFLALLQGRTDFYGSTCACFSRSGIQTEAIANLANSANLNFFGCVDLANSAFDVAAFRVQSATAIINMVCTRVIVSNIGIPIISYGAAGTVRTRQCMLGINDDVSGYIADGAAGTFLEGSNTYQGTNQQIRNTLTVQTEADVVVPTA